MHSGCERSSSTFFRPSAPEETRILYLAEYAPEPPTFSAKAFPGDGGYPEYHYEVWSTLKDLGYSVTSSAAISSSLFARGNCDFVFSLYNRMPINNSEIFVSALCEFVGVPYLGAPPNIRALAEDKWLSKLAARSLGIPVPDGIPYRLFEDLNVAPDFPGPYFVKHRFGAGSEGITTECLQDDWSGTRRVAEAFMSRGEEVLVEAFASGIDVTVPVLGDSGTPWILGYVHPRSDKREAILTEDLKMSDPLGYELTSIENRDGFVNDIHALWRAAAPMDYLRMDYRYDARSGTRLFLEFNICCFLGQEGAICLAASQWHMTQNDVLGHVVEYSLLRQRGRRDHHEWVK